MSTCAVSRGMARVALVVVTSPISAHPSVELVRDTLRSYATHLRGFQSLSIVIASDGYVVRQDDFVPHANKRGIINQDLADRYESFRDRISSALAAVDARSLGEAPTPAESAADGAGGFRTGENRRRGADLGTQCQASGDADRRDDWGFGFLAPGQATLLRSPGWLGFAGTLRAGIEESARVDPAADYVLVVQHDWALASHADPAEIAAAMDDHAMDYVVLSAKGFRTMRARAEAGEFGDLAERGVPIVETGEDGHAFVPFPHWHDKTHFARRDLYLEILEKCKIKRFPEDEFGQMVRIATREHGVHPPIGALGGRRVRTYCLTGVRIWHSDGRKYMNADVLESFVAQQKRENAGKTHARSKAGRRSRSSSADSDESGEWMSGLFG